jgi:hypothetical protein
MEDKLNRSPAEWPLDPPGGTNGVSGKCLERPMPNESPKLMRDMSRVESLAGVGGRGGAPVHGAVSASLELAAGENATRRAGVTGARRVPGGVRFRALVSRTVASERWLAARRRANSETGTAGSAAAVCEGERLMLSRLVSSSFTSSSSDVEATPVMRASAAEWGVSSVWEMTRAG